MSEPAGNLVCQMPVARGLGTQWPSLCQDHKRPKDDTRIGALHDHETCEILSTVKALSAEYCRNFRHAKKRVHIRRRKSGHPAAYGYAFGMWRSRAYRK